MNPLLRELEAMLFAAETPLSVADMMRLVSDREVSPDDVAALLEELAESYGPRGAQGVPLTAGRSIAVDRESIPYGTPVWLASAGPTASLQKLVLAQDTGSAIVGAVRADYFAGTGPQAGQLASKVNQPLRLWVLWPK